MNQNEVLGLDTYFWPQPIYLASTKVLKLDLPKSLICKHSYKIRRVWKFLGVLMKYLFLGLFRLGLNQTEFCQNQI